ncbi:spore germination protein, partial [Bacillus pumilus]|uniref:spore germination protein n=1 Tax=Bacillus pumilus TaxID=1408 RepID=UPI0011A86D24
FTPPSYHFTFPLPIFPFIPIFTSPIFPLYPLIISYLFLLSHLIQLKTFPFHYFTPLFSSPFSHLNHTYLRLPIPLFKSTPKTPRIKNLKTQPH